MSEKKTTDATPIYPITRKAISLVVRTHRILVEKTTAELADAAGIQPQRLARIEAEDGDLTVEEMQRLAMAVDITIEDLVADFLRITRRQHLHQ